MTQALNIAFQKPVLTLFTNRISGQLAESLLGSVDNESLIVEDLENGLQLDSAIHLLADAGAITYDSNALRDIQGLFQNVK